MSTWLITWAGLDDGHLTAAAVVEAETFLHALDVCDSLGITPDGASRGEQIVDWVAPEFRNRRLTPGELGRIAVEPPADGEGSKS